MSVNRTRTITWEDPIEAVRDGMKLTGLEYLQKIIDGTIPTAPIMLTLGYRLTEIEYGKAVFSGEPGEFLYNPLGVVHGGWASTLLDSAMGVAVHTTMPVGVGYTTLQLNINLVRSITVDTGPVRCQGQTIHVGRRTATAEAFLYDQRNKILAHGTTTCLVFPLDGQA